MAMAQGDGRAGELMAECLDLLRSCGDDGELASALLLAARISEGKASLAEALACAQESLEISRRLECRRGEADAQAVIARVHDTGRQYRQAVRAGREAVAGYRQSGEGISEARMTAYLGRIELRRGRTEQGLALMDRGMAQLRRLGAWRGLAVWLNIRGDLARSQNALDTASRYYEEGLAAFRSQHNRRGVSWSLANLAEVSRRIGDREAGAEMAAEAMRIRVELRDYKGMAETLECLADLALCSETKAAAVRAARLGGAADSIREMIVTPRSPAQSRERRQRMRLIRRAIGRRSPEENWRIGAEMTVAEAAAYALQAEADQADSSDSSDSSDASDLSDRSPRHDAAHLKRRQGDLSLARTAADR